MRLNHNCFRKILLYIESHCIYNNHPTFGRLLHEVSLDELLNSSELKNFSYDDIHYTIQKLFEANFINGYVLPQNCYSNFDIANISGLTMNAHNFVDNVREEPIWTETKNKLSKIGDVSISIVSQIAGETAAAYSKKMLNLP